MWGIEIDIATFAGAGVGEQFGLSINGLGGGDVTFAIKIDRVDTVSKYLYGLDVRNARIGIFVESTTGLENAIIAGSPPTRYAGTTIQAVQLANSGAALLLQRFTNSAPNGNLISCVSADNSVQLFGVDVLGNISGNTVTAQTLTAAGAAVAIANGSIQIGATTATTATAGSAVLPSNPLGFLKAFVGSVAVRIPYYNA